MPKDKTKPKPEPKETMGSLLSQILDDVVAIKRRQEKNLGKKAIDVLKQARDLVKDFRKSGDP